MDTCAVCGGARSEHFSPEGGALTIHRFTETPGDLGTTPPPPPKKSLMNNPETTPRLLAVLLSRGVLQEQDLLYITTGVAVQAPEEDKTDDGS